MEKSPGRPYIHQKEVAAYLGVSRTACSNYEKGSRESESEAKKLAVFLGIGVDELLGYMPNMLGEFSR